MRQDVVTPRSSKVRTWLRVCWPLLLWLAIFLGAVGYTGVQQLRQNTRLLASVSLAGKDVRTAVGIALDGRSFEFGNRVSFGRHELVIDHPKAEIFRTKLFIWFGARDLGLIALQRHQGVLAIQATPPARSLVIYGPEFSLTLTNTWGMTSSVPTDHYIITTSYPRWKREETVEVVAGQTTFRSFEPKLGVLRMEASHPDVTYQLRKTDRELVASGALPATIDELPEGNYQLLSTRKEDAREMRVAVKAGQTNLAQVEYLYGVALLESDPPGASVTSGGRDYGVTPLTLLELKPGSWEFSLRLADHDSVKGVLTVAANATNSFRTNLVNRRYAAAMESARQSYAEKDFDRVAKAAAEALKHKPDDLAARNLERSATGYAHLARAEKLAGRSDYAAAIKEVNLALPSLPEDTNAPALLADYTSRERQRGEAEQKRAADLADEKKKRQEKELADKQARERINQIKETFNKLSGEYENTAAFKQHELTFTNGVGVVATALNNALVTGQPAFRVVRYEPPRPDTFTLQTRQRIGFGYRECLIVGAEVRENETRILFKVLEYTHPPTSTLLGGLLTFKSDPAAPPEDPNVARAKAEKFQARVKEGVQIVTERIQRAMSRDGR